MTRSLTAFALFICSLLPGCGSEDTVEPPEWQLVFQDLPGALISISGSSERDVWGVGGDPGDGSGAFVLHFDGSKWARVSPGLAADLWWVQALPDGGPVFMGGGGGTILKYEGGSFEQMTTPSQATVFGIWGNSATDLWAVGGNPSAAGGAFVWRYDGSNWVDAPGLPSIPIASYFKVWGRSATDVRIVGMDGVILHWDGAMFSQPKSPTTQRLLTLHADADGPWVAVGGVARAVILEDAGEGWTDVTPPEYDRAMIGVRMRGSSGYAAGNTGTVLNRSKSGWVEVQHGIDIFADFHSVYIDPKGGVWAAGGDIVAQPLINGILIHRGARIPSGVFE